MKPHAAPPMKPMKSESSRSSGNGRPIQAPTTAATKAPTKNWPWAPMLNSPARNAKATERPVRISGVVAFRVFPIPRRLPSDPSRRAA